jgi:hypothetical protein
VATRHSLRDRSLLPLSRRTVTAALQLPHGAQSLEVCRQCLYLLAYRLFLALERSVVVRTGLETLSKGKSRHLLALADRTRDQRVLRLPPRLAIVLSHCSLVIRSSRRQ